MKFPSEFGLSNHNDACVHRRAAFVTQLDARLGSASLEKPDHLGGLPTCHDVLQALIPSAQHKGLALDKIGADIMADQGSGFLAARLMADDCSHEVQRDAHFRQ